MAVVVRDGRTQVRIKMARAIRNALYESGAEVAAHANRNVKSEYEAGEKLRGSYSSVVNLLSSKVTIGTPHEEGYWEEFGTGSHADTTKNGGVPGRSDWWVFVPYETPRARFHEVHRTEDEAIAEAASRRADGENAFASNGNEPHYTLEKAFIANKDKIERIFAADIGTELE